MGAEKGDADRERIGVERITATAAGLLRGRIGARFARASGRATPACHDRRARRAARM